MIIKKDIKNNGHVYGDVVFHDGFERNYFFSEQCGESKAHSFAVEHTNLGKYLVPIGVLCDALQGIQDVL